MTCYLNLQTSNIWDDDQDFNQTNVLEAIKQDLTRPDMLSTKSVFLFNLGVHFPISLSFVSYKKLIDSVIKMLLETRTDFKGGYSKKFPSIPIWRSFTAIEQEFLGVKYGAHNLTEFRFHTKPVSLSSYSVSFTLFQLSQSRYFFA